MKFLRSQAELAFAYDGIGATAAAEFIPRDYVVDRTCVELGRGETAFASARRGLEAWAQFDLGWCEAWPPDAPICVGQAVAVLARGMGMWWMNAARIVYVVDQGNSLSQLARAEAGAIDGNRFDDGGEIARFGFAYGTLPGHVESGEELFLVEWNRVTDVVLYSILAFSRPRHPLARLGRPLVRRLQRRFRDDSAAAMRRWVTREGSR
jgi:uncharacterized protein (UPF0548 family)